MKMNRRRGLITVFLLVACVVPWACRSTSKRGFMGIEQGEYTVLSARNACEIRQYAPQIVAETTVDSDFDEAGNAAFRRLYAYISGKENRTKASIAMTAPVEQTRNSEKIAMTAPVEQTQSEGKFVVSFMMPAEYTLETLPEPLNPNVRLREVPARKMAAIRYSGSWSQKRYDKKKATLKEFIAEQGLRAAGPDTFARYDPPFQLWFLRRNEVLIPVE